MSHFRHTHSLSAFGKREGWLTLEEAAQALAVSHTMVKTLIRKGILPAKQVVAFAPWVIERKDLESAQVQSAVQAAKRDRRVPPTMVAQRKLTL